MSKLKEKRRNQILIASLQAIAEKGFHSLTLQDIADYAGVSKGVTNYHFKNKEDVLRHLLEWVTDKIYENEYNAIQQEHTAIGKLTAYVEAAFSTPAENKRFFRVYIDFLGQVRHNSNFKEINDKFYDNCWSIGREIVSLGQEEGIFPSNMDIEKASISIRSLIDGCLIQWLMREQEDLHDYYKTICLETLIASLTNNNVVNQ
ncbi:TetR/AcrR family transcriptional regulator [Alteribacillus iranensis]|uniref:DNA-binding transcriptional regulator, AcrR family n=1 Tax=Alteribacillus iranensis TaxID=930128 RepID=A0A1I2EKG9_9BACI|nr:TetR/AcrR family transcriptional regulator [Alteribacillus iranensis]SFE93249.1 DNA-binding transcriptional regulator, AcrR family [Alteribacillus iranensis]